MLTLPGRMFVVEKFHVHFHHKKSETMCVYYIHFTCLNQAKQNFRARNEYTSMLMDWDVVYYLIMRRQKVLIDNYCTIIITQIMYRPITLYNCFIKCNVKMHFTHKENV